MEGHDGTIEQPAVLRVPNADERGASRLEALDAEEIRYRQRVGPGDSHNRDSGPARRR